MAPHSVTQGRAGAASPSLPRKGRAAPAKAAPEPQGRGRLSLHPGSTEITAPGDAFTSRSGSSCLSLQSPGYNRRLHSAFLPSPAPAEIGNPQAAPLLPAHGSPEQEPPTLLPHLALGHIQLSPQDCPVPGHGIHHLTSAPAEASQAAQGLPSSWGKPRPPANNTAAGKETASRSGDHHHLPSRFSCPILLTPSSEGPGPLWVQGDPTRCSQLGQKQAGCC